MVAFWTKRSRHGWGKLLCFLAFLDAELTYYMATELLPLTSKHQKKSKPVGFHHSVNRVDKGHYYILNNGIYGCELNWDNCWWYESDSYWFMTPAMDKVLWIRCNLDTPQIYRAIGQRKGIDTLWLAPFFRMLKPAGIFILQLLIQVICLDKGVLYLLVP